MENICPLVLVPPSRMRNNYRIRFKFHSSRCFYKHKIWCEEGIWWTTYEGPAGGEPVGSRSNLNIIKWDIAVYKKRIPRFFKHFFSQFKTLSVQWAQQTSLGLSTYPLGLIRTQVRLVL